MLKIIVEQIVAILDKLFLLTLTSFGSLNIYLGYYPI